jgi:hypothetical protein
MIFFPKEENSNVMRTLQSNLKELGKGRKVDILIRPNKGKQSLRRKLIFKISKKIPRLNLVDKI